MTTFDQAHAGDQIQLLGRLIPPLAREGVWNKPLTLLGDPAPCSDPACEALVCTALTPDGRRVSLHRLGSREIDVLERVSELAAHGGDDQTAGPSWTPWNRNEDPDAFDDRATPNDEGDE